MERQAPVAIAGRGGTEPAALRFVRISPVCAETPLDRHGGLLTPSHLFFLRNNFPYPTIWPGLRLEGPWYGPNTFELRDLSRLPRKRLVVTLECAGNGRVRLDPKVGGEQWDLGAVSTAEWFGTPLHDVLGGTRVAARAVEVTFHGADGFARSLPIETALHPDTLLVTEMNGAPLPHEHGGPLRLLVPRWYGMASVKWLTRIEVRTRPFTGHFQTERYVIRGRPVREMEVRAVITMPPEGAEVTGSSVQVGGYAWTGRGQVVRVDLSDDTGASWVKAQLVSSAPPYGWTRWQTTWHPHGSGPAALIARAKDSAGRLQPPQQRWNRLGYCNNASTSHRLTVVAEEKEVSKGNGE
jgi:sulfite oxidase